MSEAGITADEVKSYCLMRWGREDDKICAFNSFYEKWLDQMSDELKNVVLLLLNEFDYYSEETVKCRLKEFHTYLVEKKIIDPLYVAYCPIQKNSGLISSSMAYWSNYWLVNSISAGRCRANIKDFSGMWEYVESVVFIDDCAGTGGTFIDFLEENFDLLKGKKIVYAIIHIMENAYCKIMKTAKEKNLDIFIMYYQKKGKAFELSESLAKFQILFCNESKKLGIKESLIMGYKDSQSLIAFYNNTPNNTLGIFGEKGARFIPIFPRRTNHKVDYQKASMEKRKRNEENYNSAKGRNRL